MLHFTLSLKQQPTQKKNFEYYLFKMQELAEGIFSDFCSPQQLVEILDTVKPKDGVLYPDNQKRTLIEQMYNSVITSYPNSLCYGAMLEWIIDPSAPKDNRLWTETTQERGKITTVRAYTIAEQQKMEQRKKERELKKKQKEAQQQFGPKGTPVQFKPKQSGEKAVRIR